jgi:lysophospholipid acyltransferase (LPLAT)-like uncharacterized protein
MARTRLLDRPTVQDALAWLIASTVRLIERTARIEIELHPAAEAWLRDARPCIGAYWHGRLALIPLAWRRILAATGRDPATPAYTLSSFHRDGAVMAKATNRLGVGTVRGSQKKGGTEAFRTLRQLLNDGVTVALAVDGGKGPRMRVQAGVMVLARHAGVPAIPVTFAYRPARRLGTWDRLVLPIPFGRCLILVGEPVFPPEGRDEGALEAARIRLENGLNALTASADRRLGWEPVEPAPVPAG